jgi:NADPH:quinone reductase-like Zn-dependent oxidoreductase
MTHIKKVLIKGFGDESQLDVVQADIGEPAAGEVQVKVEYSSLSGADIAMRKGVYPFQRKAPLTPGYCVVGRVHANGPGSTLFKAGERVACLSIYDGEAELANLPERFLVPVPEKADSKQAVCLVLDWATAYEMLVRAAQVKPGQRIFIHGLSGGVGQGLLALAKLQGAEVYGTASPRNHEELKRQGATPYPYSDKNWIGAMQKIGGVDAIFDPLGFSSFDESESVLRRGGVLVGYGMNLPTLTKTPRPRHFLLEYFRLLGKNLKFWTGKRAVFFGLNRSSKYYLQDFKTLLGLLVEGKISVPVKAVFKLDDIRAAHKAWAGSSGMGSFVIDVQGN